MKLMNERAEIFIPDGTSVGEALRRTTHMAVAAHQDDIEIMAYDGIARCFGRTAKWFTGVVVTNGSGSPRSGLYADYSDQEMMRIRREEQKKAAYVGGYSAVILLSYPSGDVKDPVNTSVKDELKKILGAAAPQYLYTHNPADKHDTHVAVTVKTIKALRESAVLPEKVYGCEVWRSLDWMRDDDKVKFDVAGHDNLASALLGVFDSQICGGKRYDLATAGRRLANATYAESHAVDDTDAMIYAMDLTPLAKDRDADIGAYVRAYIDRFTDDVMDRIKGFV